MRIARTLGTSGAGVALRLLLATSLVLSFVTFAAIAPEEALAANEISRTQSPGPITIGETVDCTVTVTIETNRSLLNPYIEEEFTNRAMHYVPGSARLVDISRPVDADQVAFTDVTGDPTVIYDPDEGLKLRWELDDFRNQSDTERYTFALSYQVLVTGVGPNDFQFWFAPTDTQTLGCRSYFVWNPAANPTSTSTISSALTRTDVDQPLLSLSKNGYFTGSDIPAGAVVPFEINITNVGWSDAHDIVISDVDSGDYDPVEILQVTHSDFGDITWYVTYITDGSGNLSIDLAGYPLSPGSTISVQYLAPMDSEVTAPDTVTNTADVNWSSLDGDVTGERVYNDQDWESGEWLQDTSTATLNVVDGAYITVEKSISEGSPYAIPFGGETSFDITLSNTGSAGAGAVGLTDIYDPGMLEFVSATIAPDSAVGDGWLEWNDVTGEDGLDAGESMTISVTFRAKTTVGYTTNGAFAWDPDGFQQTSASAIGASWVRGEPDSPFGGEDSADVLIYDAEDISFTKDASPGTATVLLPGDVITYHLYGENGTGFDLPNALVSDPLPDSVEYVPGTLRATVPGYGDFTFTDTMFDPSDPDSLDDYGWYDPATRTVYFFSAWGAPQGMFADMRFDVRVRDLTYSAAGVLNQAHLAVNPTSLDGPPTVSSNAVYHFVDPITITKTATDVNGGKLIPGDEILWTITVQNIGLGPTTNVVVSDTVPAQTTYVAGSITGTGATDATAPALRWNVGVLAVGQSASMTFRSTVNAGVPSGTTISNQATVDSDQSSVRASDFPSTTVRGDATLLQTGGRELVMIVIGLIIALAGVLLVRRGRTLLTRA